MDSADQEIEVLRGMSPAKKLEVMHALIRQAYELKAAGIRTQSPETPEEKIRAFSTEP
jgi:hypothetical protein